MAMPKERPPYLSYLLRLWRISGGVRPVWRASLEHPHTGERKSFADLATLFAFLQQETNGDRLPVDPVISETDDQEGHTLH
jgi:hypothetical protein